MGFPTGFYYWIKKIQMAVEALRKSDLEGATGEGDMDIILNALDTIDKQLDIIRQCEQWLRADANVKEA